MTTEGTIRVCTCLNIGIYIPVVPCPRLRGTRDTRCMLHPPTHTHTHSSGESGWSACWLTQVSSRTRQRQKLALHQPAAPKCRCTCGCSAHSPATLCVRGRLECKQRPLCVRALVNARGLAQLPTAQYPPRDWPVNLLDGLDCIPSNNPRLECHKRM